MTVRRKEYVMPTDNVSYEEFREEWAEGDRGCRVVNPGQRPAIRD